jgi:hypothetical protein
MERPVSRGMWRPPAGRLGSEVGVTFVELLAALMAASIGAIAILAVFPLGALEMARALKDDRTAEVAVQARDLSEAGEALLARTLDFAQVSLSKGLADADQLGKLREEYEQLARESVEIEIALTNLQYDLPQTMVQRFLNPLLLQIRSIERRIAQIVQLLSLLEGRQATT